MELNEAKQLAADLVTPAEVEMIRLEDALGRVLGQDLIAPYNLPLQARSKLDGFALRSSDAASAEPARPVALRVLTGLLPAGSKEERSIEAGECIRILTGAPLPAAADTVAAQEDFREERDCLILDRPLRAGNGVAFAGEDVKEKETVVTKGEVLTPTRLALVAALGHALIPVHRQPRVALLATGDEVREIDGIQDGPWVFCNNRLLLGWLTQLQGGKTVHLGVVRDDASEIAGRLANLDADLVVTTGGIGRGDRDFILEAWKILGVRTLFRELGISPGKNSALGVKGEQIFLGLPGNPWGAQVLFEEIAAPMLRLFQGVKTSAPPGVKAILGASIRKKAGICKAVRGWLDTRTPTPSFLPGDGKGRSFFASLKKTIGYILLDAHVVEVGAGSEVRVRLHDFPLLASASFGADGFP